MSSPLFVLSVNLLCEVYLAVLSVSLLCSSSLSVFSKYILQLEMDGEELTEQGTALYDRQIRVWGADAQRRLSKSHILVCGMKGVVAEFCKNIVLAARSPNASSYVAAAANDNSLTIKLANFSNFDQIPSWVSLKHTLSSSSVKNPEKQQGKVENLHLVSLSKQGKLYEAREFLNQMDEAGVPIRPYSYERLLQMCGNFKSLSDGRYIDERLRRMEKNPFGFLENCVIHMYSDCGSLDDARRVFDEMPERNFVSWVMIISAYAQAGFLSKSILLFCDMLDSGIKPDSLIYNGLLKYMNDPSYLQIAKQLHSHVMRSGLSSNVSVNTAICNMYAKCGWLGGAELVFDQMVDKDLIAWTGLMVGYTQAGKLKDALSLFANMIEEGVELDEFVFSIILKACAAFENILKIFYFNIIVLNIY